MQRKNLEEAVILARHGMGFDTFIKKHGLKQSTVSRALRMKRAGKGVTGLKTVHVINLIDSYAKKEPEPLV